MSPLLFAGILLLLIPIILVSCVCITVILGSWMREFRSDPRPSYIGYVYVLLGIVLVGSTLVVVGV